MTKAKKKTPIQIGTVLKKVTGTDRLKPWAEYLATQAPHQNVGNTAEKILSSWDKLLGKLHFFAGTDSKSAKVEGFAHEGGLIVYAFSNAAECLSGLWGVSLGEHTAIFGGAAYIDCIATKAGSKSVAKNLSAAVERVVSEKQKNIVALSLESDTATQRTLKAQGFEELCSVSVQANGQALPASIFHKVL